MSKTENEIFWASLSVQERNGVNYFMKTRNVSMSEALDLVRAGERPSESERGLPPSPGPRSGSRWIEQEKRLRKEKALAVKRRLAERDRQWAEYEKTLYRQPRRIASRA